jgi:hypothetical protein
MYSTGTQNINLGDMNLLLLLNASNVLGIAVIRELNQAPSSEKQTYWKLSDSLG